MIATAKAKIPMSSAQTRADALDWPAVADHLDGNGWAVQESPTIRAAMAGVSDGAAVGIA